MTQAATRQNYDEDLVTDVLQDVQDADGSVEQTAESAVGTLNGLAHFVINVLRRGWLRNYFVGLLLKDVEFNSYIATSVVQHTKFQAYVQNKVDAEAHRVTRVIYANGTPIYRPVRERVGINWAFVALWFAVAMFVGWFVNEKFDGSVVQLQIGNSSDHMVWAQSIDSLPVQIAIFVILGIAGLLVGMSCSRYETINVVTGFAMAETLETADMSATATDETILANGKVSA